MLELADSLASGARAERRESSTLSQGTMSPQSHLMIKKTKIMPTKKEEPLRFVALGGFEEVGRNMMFLEYLNEIVIIDAGLQFPEESTPGIDYIIPNVSYLEERKKNVKALIITHGHYDHIGAIPYILEKIGNPPIYTTPLTREVILKRQEEFPHAPKPIFVTVQPMEIHKIGQYFTAQFFGVVHNIPDTIGVILETPVGKIVHPGEFKFDFDQEGHPKGLDLWKWVGEQGIHVLMLDSTAAERPGWSIPEKVVEKEIEKLIKNAPGRVIIATFASLLDRIGAIIHIAEKLGRKVAISGRTMKINIQIAQNLGYLKIQKGTLIPIEEINKYRDDKLVIICTGAQGEPQSALMKIANREHKYIKIKNTDLLILSSSIVPGNERSVQNLKDNLARQNPIGIYHYLILDVHSSGHSPQEELKTVMKLVKPRFFLPIHGYYFMRKQNARLAQETLGLKPEEIILPDNGQVVEIYKDSVKVTDEFVPAYYVLVDGLGVGDVGEVVLRDRRALAQEGMVVIIVVLSKQSGRILKSPDIISRGFIYLRENQSILEDIRRKIKGIIGRIPRYQPLDPDYVKTLIRDQIGQFLYNKTKRRPMILPVIIEI